MFLIQSKRYTRIIYWLISDILSRYRNQVITAVLGGALAILVQGFIFVLLIKYAGLLNANETIEFVNLSIESRSQLAIFTVATTTLLSLIFSGILLYIQHKIIISIGFSYEVDSIIRILSSLGIKFQRAEEGSNIPPDDATILQLARVDSMYLNRMTRIILLTPVTVFTFIISTILLIYLSPFLSSLIIPFLLITSVYMYRLNIRAAGMSIQYEKITPDAFADLRSVLEILKGNNNSLNFDTAPLVDALHTKNLSRWREFNKARILIPQEAQLLGNILLAICLTVILLYFGLQAMYSNSVNWGVLIGYLIALRFSLTSLKSFAGQFTSLNRFYPFLRRYFEFLNVDGELKGNQLDMLHFKNVKSEVAESLGEWKTVHGQIISLITSMELNRYSFPFLLNSMIEGDDTPIEDFLASSDFLNYRKVGGNNVNELMFKKILSGGVDNKLGLESNLKLPDVLKEWIDTGINIGKSNGLAENDNKELEFVLSGISLANESKMFVFIDERGVNALPREIQIPFLKIFKHKTVFLHCGPKARKVGRYREIAVIILSQYEGIKAILNTIEFKWNLELLNKLTQSNQGSYKSKLTQDPSEVELMM